MSRTNFWRVLVWSCLVAVPASAADKWTHLRAGMTRTEAVAVLGGELAASRARDFEVAIYDNRAEVVYLRGQVVAWTAPSSSEAAPSPANTWEFAQTPRARNNVPSSRRPSEGRPGNGRILPAYRM